jgi:hypothetical protein
VPEPTHYDLIPERFHTRVRKICMRFPDWDEIAELVEESYRHVAPKTLVRTLDGR